jgi:uncharacterized protein YabE (DUF348 family)/3D (Asp-Asp-Asp) domain-containing protein
MAILFFVSVTAFAVPSVMYNVTIYDGDNTIVVTTAQRDAEKILESQGITVNEAYGDSVSLANFDGENDSVIIIKRGVKVSIVSFDGTTHTIHTSGTVGDAIKLAGVTPPKGTALNYGADVLLEDGMVIEIYDIFNVKITADGKKLEKTISGKTVKQAVEAAGITLGENDFTKPSLDTKLTENMAIEVFRVKLVERVADEAIEFGTEYEYTDTQYTDQRTLLSAGVNGSKTVIYEDCYVNGELSTSTALSETVIEEPVNQLVRKGTKERPVAVQTYPSSLPVGAPISEMANPESLVLGADGVPTTYSKVINAKATAYCIPGGTTSTGKRAQTGYIAVDPREIPYGTEMYIVSADGRYVYGYCIAADTGGYIYSVDWTVDLYMNTEAQCRQWGRRSVIIYVL